MISISIATIPLQVDLIDMPRTHIRAAAVDVAVTSAGRILDYRLRIFGVLETGAILTNKGVNWDSKLQIYTSSRYSDALEKEGKTELVVLSLFQYYFYDWSPSAVGAKQNFYITNRNDLRCRLSASVLAVNDLYSQI